MSMGLGIGQLSSGTGGTAKEPRAVTGLEQILRTASEVQDRVGRLNEQFHSLLDERLGALPPTKVGEVEGSPFGGVIGELHGNLLRTLNILAHYEENLRRLRDL